MVYELVDKSAPWSYGHKTNGSRPGRQKNGYNPVPVTPDTTPLSERLFALACEVQELEGDLSNVSTEDLMAELSRRIK